MSPARVHLILLLLRIGIGALSLNLMDNSITFSKRASHSTFFKDRDWPAVTTLWRYLMKQEWATTNLPTVDQEIKFTNFEVTNLDTIHKIGLTEYSSADPRYKRKTFAMRIGYDGSSYNGYQSQKGSIGVRTVEEELFDALGGRTCCAAGRTDGDVSAISQIICFSTYDEVTPESLLINVAASEAAQSERLRVFECVRAPRRFHSLFGATWRRYLYVMPLNKGTYDGGVDVDVAFVNAALRRLEGRKLPYNAFAYREDRAVDQTDHCTLYCARAFLVHLDSPSTVERVESVDSDTQFESVPMGLCVELVGDRFLRRMVRILVSTVVRASVTHEADDSFVRENILLDIALRGEREDASVACSGLGLCLAGVGYDLTDLALNKVKVKSVRQPVNDIQTQALREKKSRAVPNGQFETSDDVVSEDISDADGNSDGV